MEIKISQGLSDSLSYLRIGIIQALVEVKDKEEELENLKASVLEDLISKYKLEEIKEIPSIHSSRQAYRKIGNDPNRYRPAADALLRRIIKGNGLYTINTLVDSLNLISIQSGFSISGFDAGNISGTIEMGIGQEGELYEGVGRGKVNIKNLLVLRDDIGAFGCPTSDSIRTMITSDSRKILFIFYDFGGHPHLEESLNNCSDLLKRFSFAQSLEQKIRSVKDK